MSIPVAVASSTNALVTELRIRGVADGVAPPQQHLQADVGHRLAKRRQPIPRIFLQEPQRDIVGRPAPAFDRQQLRGHPGDVGRHRQQPGGAQPRRQQRLMRVPERGVGDTHRLRLAQPAREPLRAQLHQALLAARRRRRGEVDRGQLVVRVHRRRARPVRLVDRHVGEVVEDLGATVGRRARGQQIRPLVDERGRDPSGPEVRVVDHGHAGTGCWSTPPGSGTRQARGGPGRPPRRSRGPRQVSLTSIESKCALISAPRLRAAVQPDTRAAG